MKAPNKELERTKSALASALAGRAAALAAQFRRSADHPRATGVRTTRISPVIVAITALSVVAASCSRHDEDLPIARVRQFSIQAPDICTQPPAAFDVPRPVLTPGADPGLCFSHRDLQRFAACLNSPAPSDSLALELAIDPAGHVVKIGTRLYDWCAVCSHQPDPPTLRCLNRAFATWRFAPDHDACPRVYYMQRQPLDVLPRKAGRQRLAANPVPPCGG